MSPRPADIPGLFASPELLLFLLPGINGDGITVTEERKKKPKQTNFSFLAKIKFKHLKVYHGTFLKYGPLL